MISVLKSVGALAAGFLFVAITTTAADALMYALGIFPHSPQNMTDSLFVLASAYRALLTAISGYITAHLAPSRPMRHVYIGAGIGLTLGTAGIIAYFTAGAEKLGPLWYAIVIAAEAVPCVLIGGWIAVRRQKAS